MTSAIVRTNPTSGTATTSSVRDNFGSAADEINVLQRSSTDLKPTTGGTISYAVNFGSSPTFSLVDGARISVRINATNTAAPTIIVSPGSTDISIVKPDGSALAAGDLIANSIYDLMYNATISKWVAFNAATLTSSAFVSPAFTGVPTSPTAAEGTDTTQLATTAFVQAATPDASDSVKGLIELATDAEVKAGVDAVKALTAANLLRVAVDNTQVTSNGDQGSIEIAGVVVKWGEFDIPSGTTQTITFDDAFPNFCSVAYTQREATNAQSVVGVVAGSRTAASFQVDTNNFSATIYWLAIGG
jgi:hypothetical protein